MARIYTSYVMGHLKFIFRGFPVTIKAIGDLERDVTV